MLYALLGLARDCIESYAAGNRGDQFRTNLTLYTIVTQDLVPAHMADSPNGEYIPIWTIAENRHEQNPRWDPRRNTLLNPPVWVSMYELRRLRTLRPRQFHQVGLWSSATDDEWLALSHIDHSRILTTDNVY